MEAIRTRNADGTLNETALIQNINVKNSNFIDNSIFFMTFKNPRKQCVCYVEEKTKGGLIIPDAAKEKPAEGEVVSVGSGARKDNGELIAMDVKAGDTVLFGKWSGTEVKIDGEDLLIMKESDILGIL